MGNDKLNIPPYNEEGYSSRRRSRAEDVRRDDDTVKIPSITLYDIDYAILFHLNENLSIQVKDGDRIVPVPAFYASGEKWVQIKRRGYMRDRSGKLIAPAIAIRRGSVDADDRLMIPDYNNYKPRFSRYPLPVRGPQYLRRQGERPTFEYFLLEIPTYVRVSYELIVWAFMVEHVNKIVETIIGVSGHMWGDLLPFRTVVSGVSTEVMNNVGEERMATANISLTVDGYLRPEFEYHEATMQKAFSIKNVRVINEYGANDVDIVEPVTVHDHRHITAEPKYAQALRKKRNLRFR